MLIDADSTIPNLALMKLSTYYKNKGYTIDLFKLYLPYYPNRKKRHISIDTHQYDKVFCSVIFDGNLDYIHGDNIQFGGTGFNLTTVLSDEIEYGEVDYSIYPNVDTSYGFITRGCIRNCYFCKVPEKEGMIHQVNQISDIVRHKKVKFMDNNILALPCHEEILEELVHLQIKCQFNQGLDLRLLTAANSELLSELNYLGEYTFAFDDIKYMSTVEKQLKLIEWRKPWRTKFFVYVHPKMPLKDTILRVEWLKERELLPYVMRDISCWESEYNKFYIDLAGWANQPGIFKLLTFEDYLDRRHKNKGRVSKHRKLYLENH